MKDLQSIDHRYRILRLLGEGMTGEVYLVESHEGRLALKLLKPFPDPRLEEDILSAFKFEFGLLKDLRHPHVVRIQDFGFDETLKRFYFTEEFLEGLPLDKYIRGKPTEVLEELFIQASEGLQAIHRAHLLHGDLKPSNLLVVESPTGPVVKIIDLGLADPRFPITAGTPSTMPPEKILGDPFDQRSDLYSLGVVFYSLFTGKNPLVKNSLKETYEAHLRLKPPKATLLNSKIPTYWNEIFEALLAKNPNYRYRHCGELLEAIDLARPGRGPKPARASPWAPERWVARPQLMKKILEKIREALGKETERRRDGENEKKNYGGLTIFLLVGEKGVGKSRIAQELKYQLQMDQVRVFESKVEAGRHLPDSTDFSGLWIVDRWSRFGVLQKQLLEHWRIQKNKSVVVLTVLPEEEKPLRGILEESGWSPLSITIPPLTPEDLGDFLKQITGLREIPKSFFGVLWDKTQGNTKQVLHSLEKLVQGKRLTDEHGQWNLAIFKEGAWDISGVDTDLVEDESVDDFQKAEAEITQIKELDRRLHARASLYERKGYQALRHGQFERARNELVRSLALLEESGIEDQVLAIRIQNFIGWLFCQEGKYDEAIEIFLKQHEQWKDLPEAERRKILNNELGFSYLQKGDWPKALQWLSADLSFYERVGDPASLAKCLYNLGEAHLMGKNFPQAAQFYLRVLELARSGQNYELLLRTYNGLGKTRHLQGEMDEALSHYQRALDLARYLKDYSSASAIAQNIGTIFSEKGEWELAKIHLELSLKMLKKITEKSVQVKYLQSRALLELADLFRKQRMFEDAMGFVREARSLAFEEASLFNFRFWVVYTQCQIEKDQGRMEKLQDLVAELLPLADDEEKRAKCKEFEIETERRRDLPGGRHGGETEKEIQQTRVESIQPRIHDVTLTDVGRSTELQALIRVARWLASERDPEKLLTLMLRQAVELAGAEAGWVLLESGSGEMEPRAKVNLDFSDPLFPMSRTIAGQVLRSGQPVLTDDALKDERFRAEQSVVDLQLRSLLALPIYSQNRILGVLALVHRQRERAFSGISLDLLKAFADQAGIALEQARRVADLEDSRKKLQEDLAEAQEELSEARQDWLNSSLLLRFADLRLISQNKVMLELFQVVERIRDTELSVVLYGESGTGKELIARSLHQHSRRSRSPFVAVNCAALPENLIESELFGYRAGAFTGAIRDKKGLIEEAGGGTLFLDEIAELNLPLQAKLLRVLQEREITRLGDTRPTPVKFRLIAASHKRLPEQVAQGRFREDLYYRVCEIELALPPLRDRKEDVPLLAEAFAKEYLNEHGDKAKVKVGRDLLQALMNYDWPGNVRELVNVIRVATALRQGAVLHVKDLPASLQAQLVRGKERERKEEGKRGRGEEGISADPTKSWRELELIIIGKALIHFDFDIQKTAKALGCAASKLYQRKRERDWESMAEELKKHPMSYDPQKKLEEYKKEAIQAALKHCQNSPYQAARLLKVSPGMIYQWIH